MEASKSVVFPNEMLAEMEIEDTFFPTNSKQIGIAVLSHFQDSAYIMRIYQLLHKNESDSFEPIQELASFSFSSKEHFEDRKSTRLNSSHVAISYAVFCLKK